MLQLARQRYPGSPVFVFARNADERRFARELGAAWSGDTADTPPEALAAIIDTTPAWRPVVSALAHLAPGGRLLGRRIDGRARWRDNRRARGRGGQVAVDRVAEVAHDECSPMDRGHAGLGRGSAAGGAPAARWIVHRTTGPSASAPGPV